jgi:hypothetical protein
MSKKPDFKTAIAVNHDEESAELTVTELAEKGVTIQGFGLTPNQMVYVPTLAEGRQTFKRAIRKGGDKNVPVVACAIVVKDGDKFKFDGKVTEVGISSLFQLDHQNKPHEKDGTCKATAHLANHSDRLDKLGGSILVAGDQEVTILVPRTERSTDAAGKLHINRLYNDDGSLQVRQKRIVPSNVIWKDDIAWKE